MLAFIWQLFTFDSFLQVN